MRTRTNTIPPKRKVKQKIATKLGKTPKLYNKGGKVKK